MRTTSSPNLSTEIAPRHPVGLKLANPVMVASGTFGWDGYGKGLLGDGSAPEETTFQSLGAIVAKTVTMRPREGNPDPRWFPSSWRQAREAGECIYLNSIGLTNPGIKTVLEEQAPLWAGWKAPVVLSIAGETVEQFGSMAAMVDGTPGIAAIELNLSCPNIENGAHFSHSPQLSGETVGRVKSATSLPVIPKLSPNVPDIVPIAEAVAHAGADAITITNTIPAMTIDIETRRPVLGGITGGISGPALRPVAVALVYRAAQAVDVPIIGVGGIFTSRDALEFIMAGASGVQVGSANLTGFHAPLEVVDGLRAYMGEHGIADIAELVGAAWKDGKRGREANDLDRPSTLG